MVLDKKASSATKKTSKKSAEKYASKLIGEVIDVLTEKALKKVKSNTKTTTKWLGKMKLSIQKKVSQASQQLFVKKAKGGRPSTSKEDPATLKAEIASIKNEIAGKVGRIKDQALKALKQSAKKLKPAAPAAPAAQASDEQGRFDGNLRVLEEKLKEIAQTVDSEGNDIVGRIAAMRTTINTVEGDFAKIKASGSGKSKAAQGTNSKSVPNSSSSSLTGTTPAAVRVGRTLQ